MASGDISSAEKQALVTSFLDIAAGQSSHTATRFLQATNWNLEEALQLFFVNGEVGGVVAADQTPTPVADQVARAPPVVNDDVLIDPGEDDEVRAPLPAIRDTLYGDAGFVVLQPSSVVAFRNFEQESRQPAVWDADQNAPSSSRENLASLYRPPFALMYDGPFEKAKLEASGQGKWLLVNLQSTKEFSSHMLNRDTWANETVAQTIRSNFIFWQVYHDSAEGRKVCTYYQLVSMPAILVIDPITGQKMRAWSGMVQPDRLLEDLLPYLDKSLKDHHAVQPQKRPRKTALESASSKVDKSAIVDDEEIARALAASLEESKVGAQTDDKDEPEKEAETSLNGKPDYPPLPEEPTGSRDQLCRVGIRLPDGRRLQRNFLRTDPVKLLWSFCSTQVEGGEKRSFHFAHAIPGASKNLEYGSDQTFEEAGLSNSMVILLWD